MGAVATNPEMAPFSILESEEKDSEFSLNINPLLEITAQGNYTGFAEASQGGKHLCFPRESPMNR
jgi:hypothetical protein